MFNKAGFKKYFQNTSWLLAERVFRLCTEFVVWVYIARFLGPDGLGVIGFAQSYVGLFIPVVMLGLNVIVVKDLVDGVGSKEVLLGSTFALIFLGSILAITLLLFGMQFLTLEVIERKVVFILALSLFFYPLHVIDFYFQSIVLSKYVVYAKSVQAIVGALLKLYLLYQKADLVWFAYALLFDVVLLGFGLLYFYWKQGLLIKKWRANTLVMKRLLKSSYPLLFSGIAISVYMKIDQVMIKQFLGAASVGNYVAAVRISEVWYFFPMAIAGSVFPALLNAKRVSKDLYENRFILLFSLMFVMALSIALPVTFLSPWLVSSVYGESYLTTASVLSIHIWAGLSVFLGVVRGKWMVAEGMQVYDLSFQLFGAFANIALNYFMIPKFGINGAAYATLVSYFLATLCAPLLFNKTRAVSFMMFRACFASPFELSRYFLKLKNR